MRHSLDPNQKHERTFLPGYLSLFSLCVFGHLLLTASLCSGKDFRSIRVPSGFRVSQFADDDLAHDVFSMTTDSKGRIVVAGPGYVRILLDENHDGKADRYVQYADAPKNGAQGMYFDGRDLLCIGDRGLLRFRDRNADDRADSPPELLLKLKTGGEHHTHAIRKGPDGWWYVIAGNQAGVSKKYVTTKSSPVASPQAGVVLRIAGDFSASEIVAHGFRNAYDFDFNSAGDLFVYDSDGERDVSLPWYRPTRVFHALPGSHAGWMSASWKRPNYFFSMPPVVGSLGRGSPTGVVCYRHRSFPKKYRNSLFVLDWTFGRVDFLPLKKNVATWKSQPTIFMSSTGEFGFAPTDAVVDPKGDLYISVGGRGTRGGVFRVRYVGKKIANKNTIHPTIDNPLESCLDIPQPLSSWARAKWVPLANQIGPDPFLKIVLDESQPLIKKLRAIDILTELFGGLSTKQLGIISKSSDAEIRAKAIWSYARLRTRDVNFALLAHYLSDAAPIVKRQALEVLLRAIPEAKSKIPVRELVTCLGSQNRIVRQTASRCVAKLDAAQREQIQSAISPRNIRAMVAYSLGRLSGNTQFRGANLQTAFDAFLLAGKSEDRLDALRTMQLALGGPGSENPKSPAVFHGYRSRIDDSTQLEKLKPIVARLENIFPTEERSVDLEMSRFIAMLQPRSLVLLQKVLNRITEKSHPTDDVHYLIVASQIRGERNRTQTLQTANALLNLDRKIRIRKLHQDNNWDSRILEIYSKLKDDDPALLNAILQNKQFGFASQIIFLKGMNSRQRQLAIDTIVKRIRSDSDYQWSSATVFLLGESLNAEHRKLVRSQLGRLVLRPAILQVLSRHPRESDRDIFLSGLVSSRLEVLNACLNALQKLEPNHKAAENLILLKTLSRLGRDRGEYAIREKVVRLLMRNTRRQFGFQFGKKGHRPQLVAIGRWEAWLRKAFPVEYETRFSSSSSDSKRIETWLVQSRGKTGNILRGKILFEKQACAECHGRRRALGPDLAGVSNRFSRKDLLTAILDPNRDVSPRYQTTSIVTDEGKIYSGLVIYESVDGVTLRDSSQRTIRIEANNIETKKISSQSLMPEGLLKDCSNQDILDLFAYLKTLRK